MNKYVTKPDDLVTTPQETRVGFVAFALEKNRKSTPYIEQAKALRVVASAANTPSDLVAMKEIESALLSAAGLSDKALKYFSDSDKERAIQELVSNFLEPAGNDFVDELVYRYLLIKGDSLGGSMRNMVGAFGQQKFIRSFISVLRVLGISYLWVDSDKKAGWIEMSDDDLIVEQNAKAIAWKYEGATRVLGFNMTIPLVGKNVDLCIFDVDTEEYLNTRIQDHPNKIVLLGELKGGVDPAGADEHWKTARSALLRIDTAFKDQDYPINTVFIGAAIESSMSVEIFNMLMNGELTNAANLSDEQQLADVCHWMITL